MRLTRSVGDDAAATESAATAARHARQLALGGLVLLGLMSGCLAVGTESGEPSRIGALATPAAGDVVHVDLRVPMAAAASAGTPCDAASLGSHTTGGRPLSSIPGATFSFGILRGRTLGQVKVPSTGIVLEQGGGDSPFPMSCSFRFDVPSDRSADAFTFSVGDIYFPVPLVSRDQLAANDWKAIIGVHVDQ